MNKKLLTLTAKIISIILTVALLILAGLYAVYLYQYGLEYAFVWSGEESRDPNLIYEKKDFPVLCEAPGNYSDPFGEGVCYLPSRLTRLYISGKLATEMGYGSPDSIKVSEKQLPKSQIEKVLSEIRKSDVLNKECPAGSLEEKRAHYDNINIKSFQGYLKKDNLQIEDYEANYYLNLDGIKKEIEFPGCQEELDKIDKLISNE